MSECNDGVVLTNDPDHPYVQCQRCGELEADRDYYQEAFMEAQKYRAQAEATIAELKGALDDCGKAPFETVSEIREYVRSVKEKSDG